MSPPSAKSAVAGEELPREYHPVAHDLVDSRIQNPSCHQRAMQLVEFPESFVLTATQLRDLNEK
jgi:hypothetical protein